ncbi:hypothetical protein AB3K78_09195 [Leucobacter sp. HNU]|uniref:hypothetical protein n=1 Tax=Leucobacter sp. HNU TaxID=3236805 RepID=UPI003A8036EE
MGMKFLKFCLAVLAGVILLYLAVCLLTRFWVWLAVIALVAVTLWIGVAVWRRWRDGW